MAGDGKSARYFGQIADGRDVGSSCELLSMSGGASLSKGDVPCIEESTELQAQQLWSHNPREHLVSEQSRIVP